MKLRGVPALGISVREGEAEGPTGRRETPTHTCRHCNCILLVPHGATYEDIGGFCPHCQSVVCKSCAMKAVRATSAREACQPFYEKIDAVLAKHALRQAMGL